MTKKDTIIIAVLVNICLLALLFVLAIRVNEDEGASSTYLPLNGQLTSTITVKETITNKTILDEMDDFLKELPREEIGQPILVDEDGYIELDRLEPAVVVSTPSKGVLPPLNPEENYVNITVKSGDALEKIARNNGTTVEAIQKANNLNSSKLSIGQVLRVPISKNTLKQKPTGAPPPQNIAAKENDKKSANSSTEVDPKYYTIKNGDSLWKIARDLQVKPEELMQMNGLTTEKARNLKIGDKIRVR